MVGVKTPTKGGKIMLYTIIQSINRYSPVIIRDIADITEMIEHDPLAIVACLQLLSRCYEIDNYIVNDFLSVYREQYGNYGEAIVLDDLIDTMVYKTDDFRQELIREYL